MNETLHTNTVKRKRISIGLQCSKMLKKTVQFSNPVMEI